MFFEEVQGSMPQKSKFEVNSSYFPYLPHTSCTEDAEGYGPWVQNEPSSRGRFWLFSKIAAANMQTTAMPARSCAGEQQGLWVPRERWDGLAVLLDSQHGFPMSTVMGSYCSCLQIPKVSISSSCQLEAALSLALGTLAWLSDAFCGLIETLNVIAPTQLSRIILFSFLMKCSVYFSLYQGCWRGF